MIILTIIFKDRMACVILCNYISDWPWNGTEWHGSFCAIPGPVRIVITLEGGEQKLIPVSGVFSYYFKNGSQGFDRQRHAEDLTCLLFAKRCFIVEINTLLS